MNPFWAYFWPLFAFGLAAGAILGLLGFRRRRRLLIAAGAALTLGGAALWHWPLGAADRLVAKVESTAEFVLTDWEMSQVQARLHREPLTRRLLLSGPADDFQRTELVRMMSTIPGVSTATWSRGGGLPLIIEAAGASLLGFLVGLLLAYVAELRRRYNAQWKW
jgi:hypothetical protein